MGNFFEDVIQPDPRYTSRSPINDPALLESKTRAAVAAIIADAAQNGVELMIFETYRSQDRQALLYSQGVTQLKTLGVHHYGLACDLVKSIDGEPNWKGDFTIIGQLAQAHGLIWGGDWGRPDLPHSFRDYPHVQRCSIPDQAKLFRGEWYPDDNYNPYGSSAPGSGQSTVVYCLTDPMMTGDKVREIQESLAAAGFDPGGTDGVFGPRTKAAVISFQQSNGLSSDGAVGFKTAAALGVNLKL